MRGGKVQVLHTAIQCSGDNEGARDHPDWGIVAEVLDQVLDAQGVQGTNLPVLQGLVDEQLLQLDGLVRLRDVFLGRLPPHLLLRQALGDHILFFFSTLGSNSLLLGRWVLQPLRDGSRSGDLSSSG